MKKMVTSDINRPTNTTRPINKSISTQQYDVVIVGGGISGAWLALHCAKSGYKTILIEKGDYASQTSSASSKLLHGGVRYLQQMQFNKVRESAMERAHYMYAAPHYSAPVPFVVPTYKDFQRSKFFLNCGMLAYQILCLGQNRLIDSNEQNLPTTHSISPKELDNICKLTDNTSKANANTGAVVFYEQHMLNSERMVLAILATAHEYGAETFNYVNANHVLKQKNEIIGIQAQDMLSNETFDIKSHLVINAAGPWIDSLNSTINDKPNVPSITGFAIGSHLITKQITDHAIALTTKHQSDAKLDRGGRHVFIIPWRGHSLIGTSYDETENQNDDLSLQPSHVEQLLEVINESLPDARLNKDDLISGYSGLYPLKTDNIQSSVYQGSGEYQIIDHAKTDKVEGMVTALGAKFTTGRKLSALTMKIVDEKLGGKRDLSKTKLHNSNYASLSEFTNKKITDFENLLPIPTIKHLISHYGSDIDSLMEYISDEPKYLTQINDMQPDIFGQIIWAIDHEQAVTLEDVIYRRTSLAFLGLTNSELTGVAEFMAERLGWSEQELKEQINQNIARLDKTKTALYEASNSCCK